MSAVSCGFGAGEWWAFGTAQLSSERFPLQGYITAASVNKWQRLALRYVLERNFGSSLVCRDDETGTTAYRYNTKFQGKSYVLSRSYKFPYISLYLEFPHPSPPLGSSPYPVSSPVQISQQLQDGPDDFIVWSFCQRCCSEFLSNDLSFSFKKVENNGQLKN